MIFRRRQPPPAEPAQVYASYPRNGGGRTHLMPVTLWASEVETPTAVGVSAWVIPMMVHTGTRGEPLSVGLSLTNSVHVETTV